ncbi:hypothetical protein FAM09_00185 [Niastella caeni]|uniref:Uncharacterized protein n=1 Tax=Niastella caeni TaxID=2569763 RepID=A0A4S8HXS1_9BACT|nr:hypothetical protein [Niastella caeni]THU40568.1 hypothetical protein FAM09_00185 [Niastella caeni]
MKRPGIRDAVKNQGSEDITNSKEKNSSLRWILLIPFILVLGMLAALYRQDQLPKSIERLEKIKPGKQGAVTGGSGNDGSSVKKMVRNNIRLYVKAESNDYEHSRLGGISDLEISVTNSTDYTLDKVRVKIMYVKANGNIYETKYEDFLSIKPNSKTTHKIPDTRRGTSVKYEISSIKSKALGLG